MKSGFYAGLLAAVVMASDASAGITGGAVKKMSGSLLLIGPVESMKSTAVKSTTNAGQRLFSFD